MNKAGSSSYSFTLADGGRFSVWVSLARAWSAISQAEESDTHTERFFEREREFFLRERERRESETAGPVHVGLNKTSCFLRHALRSNDGDFSVHDNGQCLDSVQEGTVRRCNATVVPTSASLLNMFYLPFPDSGAQSMDALT